MARRVTQTIMIPPEDILPDPEKQKPMHFAVYWGSVAFIATCMWMLNTHTSIVVCSALFTCIVFVVNMLAVGRSEGSAFRGVIMAMCVVLYFSDVWHYCIGDTILHWLKVVSLLSIVGAGHYSSMFYVHLDEEANKKADAKDKTQTPKADKKAKIDLDIIWDQDKRKNIVRINLICFGVAIVIDTLCIGTFFVMHGGFAYTKILLIMAKELSTKLVYGGILSLCAPYAIQFATKYFPEGEYIEQLDTEGDGKTRQILTRQGPVTIHLQQD